MKTQKLHHYVSPIFTSKVCILLSDIIISHPDEMDKLEQYRAITDYKRANTHQVDLEAGQIVHVIEKHDTG